jgi:hypothetical protein
VTVPAELRLQEKSVKASTAHRAAGLRMSSYTAEPARSQMCSVLLALALVMLPMVGVQMRPETVPTPLRTQLVPFGAGVQSLPSPSPQAQPRLASGVRLFTFSTATFVTPLELGRCQRDLRGDGRAHLNVIALPAVRSPPRS